MKRRFLIASALIILIMALWFAPSAFAAANPLSGDYFGTASIDSPAGLGNIDLAFHLELDGAGTGRIRFIGLYVSPVQGSVDLGTIGYHIGNSASPGTPPNIPADTQVVTLSGQVYTVSGTAVDLVPVSATFTTIEATATGSVTVNILPQAAIDGGAQWRLDGGGWHSSGFNLTNVNVGQHTVQFSDLTGWTKPADRTVTVQHGQVATSTGTYTTTLGSLQVTLAPQGAVDAGARWQVDGGEWQVSGATVAGLTAGLHAVTFKDIAGWTKPADQTVAVQSGQLATATGTYAAATASLQVTIDPQAAIDAGARWQVDGGEWRVSGATVESLAAGLHQVAFKDATGWITPSPQTVTLVSGQLKTSSATYGAGEHRRGYRPGRRRVYRNL